MAVVTNTQETTSPVAANRLFKALALERHAIVPKLMPQAFKSVEIVEGNGGVGTITKVSLPDGKYMLQRIDEVDIGNFFCKYTIFEGEVLRELESVTHEVKFTPSGEGCIAKMISYHRPKPGAVVDEAEVKVGLEKGHVMFKKVEEYLLANPSVCA